jgi:hypothetical protein
MAELADAVDSKSSGRPEGQLAKCPSFFISQQIRRGGKNPPGVPVQFCEVLLGADGYSLATARIPKK